MNDPWRILLKLLKKKSVSILSGNVFRKCFFWWKVYVSVLCRNVELQYLMVWQHLCCKGCFQKFIVEDILLLLHDSTCTHFYQTLSTLALYTREVFPGTVSLDSALRPPMGTMYVPSHIYSLACSVGQSSLLFRIYLTAFLLCLFFLAIQTSVYTSWSPF